MIAKKQKKYNVPLDEPKKIKSSRIPEASPIRKCQSEDMQRPGGTRLLIFENRNHQLMKVELIKLPFYFFKN